MMQQGHKAKIQEALDRATKQYMRDVMLNRWLDQMEAFLRQSLNGVGYTSWPLTLKVIILSDTKQLEVVTDDPAKTPSDDENRLLFYYERGMSFARNIVGLPLAVFHLAEGLGSSYNPSYPAHPNDDPDAVSALVVFGGTFDQRGNSAIIHISYTSEGLLRPGLTDRFPYSRKNKTRALSNLANAFYEGWIDATVSLPGSPDTYPNSRF